MFRMVGPTGNREGHGRRGRESAQEGRHTPSPALVRVQAAHPEAPTSVCSHRTPTGHHKLVFAERQVVLTPSRGEAGGNGCVDLHYDSEFCSNTNALLQ